jgi:two-component system, LytTR family, sensor kinase
MIIDHPVFKNLKSLGLYILIWILTMGIHFYILFGFYEQSMRVAVIDSLVFNTLFAFFGLSLWFTIGYSKPNKTNLFNLIFHHLTSLTIIVLIWISVGSYISQLFINNSEYQSLIVESIPWRVISAVFLYSIIALIYYLVMYYHDLQEKYKNEIQLNETIIESELNLLKSQINPHFLFNSLNSISSLTVSDGEKAREMIIKLSDFLRHTVSKDNNRFTVLGKEIENVKRYLEIEKVRFGKKLQFEFNLEGGCNEVFIPVMILQPLYENAVKHGVYESTDIVTIVSDCKMKEDHMWITILNNYDNEATQRKGAGIGLKNIKDRLKLIYKNDKLIKTTKSETEFKVELFIPYRSKNEEI